MARWKGSQGGGEDEEAEEEGKCQRMIATLTSACEGLLAAGALSATPRCPDNEIWVNEPGLYNSHNASPRIFFNLEGRRLIIFPP